jgi:hypothetical protein
MSQARDVTTAEHVSKACRKMSLNLTTASCTSLETCMSNIGSPNGRDYATFNFFVENKTTNIAVSWTSNMKVKQI